MVLYSFIAVMAAIIIGISIAYVRDGGRYRDLGDDLIYPILAVVFLGSLISSVVCGIGVINTPGGTMDRQGTYGLRALVTKTDTSSSANAVFFLGFGGASSETSSVTSISYIRVAKDGGSTLRKSWVGNSVIYEDGADKPRVEDWRKMIHNNFVFVPWDFKMGVGDVEHRFHIPAGSILQSYEVKP